MVKDNKLYSKFLETIDSRTSSLLERKSSPKERLYAEYIDILFKIRERDQIIRWITDSIRNSLDLDQILSTVACDIGRLFEVDRSLIALFDKRVSEFYLHDEYTLNESIPSVFTRQGSAEIASRWHETLIIKKNHVIVEDFKLATLTDEQKEYFTLYGVKSLVIIPLIYKEKLLGAIILHQTQKSRKWSLKQTELLKDIGYQISTALEHAELYSNIKQQAAREALLRNIISTIRNSLDVVEILTAVCDQVANLFNVQRAAIVEYPDKDNYKKAVFKREYLENFSYKGFEGFDQDKRIIEYVAKIVVDNETILSINNIQESDTPEFFKNSYKEMGVKSIIYLPIKKDNEKWGILALSEYGYCRHWTEDDINLLKSITHQLNIAISQAELYATTKKQAEREKLLRNITSLIRSSLDIDDVLNTICQKISELLTVERVAIVDVQCDKDPDYTVRYEYTPSSDFSSIRDSKLPKYFRHYWANNILIYEKITVIDNIEEVDTPEEILNIFRDLGTKSLLSVPLRKDDELWGFIVISQYSSIKHWTEDEINLLKSISDQIYLAIRQAEMYSTIKKQVEKETLLRSDDSIVIDRKLAKAVGLNGAISYSALAGMYNYFKDEGSIGIDGFLECDISDITAITYLSDFEQEEVIQKLRGIGLIEYIDISKNRIGIKILEDKDLIKKCLEMKQKNQSNNNPVESQDTGKVFYSISELESIYSSYYSQDATDVVFHFFEKSKQISKGKKSVISRLYYAVIYRTLYDFMMQHSINHDRMIQIINEWFGKRYSGNSRNIVNFGVNNKVNIGRLQKILIYRLQEAKILATDFYSKMDFYSHPYFDIDEDQEDFE